MLPDGWQMVAFAAVYVGVGLLVIVWGFGALARGMASRAGRRDILQVVRSQFLRPSSIFLLLLAALGIFSTYFSD